MKHNHWLDVDCIMRLVLKASSPMSEPERPSSLSVFVFEWAWIIIWIYNGTLLSTATLLLLFDKRNFFDFKGWTFQIPKILAQNSLEFSFFFLHCK